MTVSVLKFSKKFREQFSGMTEILTGGLVGLVAIQKGKCILEGNKVEMTLTAKEGMVEALKEAITMSTNLHSYLASSTVIDGNLVRFSGRLNVELPYKNEIFINHEKDDELVIQTIVYDGSQEVLTIDYEKLMFSSYNGDDLSGLVPSSN